jgi:hypothetical protein
VNDCIHLAADVLDLALPGLPERTVFELAGDGPATVHGIVPVDSLSQALALVNVGGHDVLLKHLSNLAVVGHGIYCEETCPTCAGNVRVNVYGCQRHGLCTLGKPLMGKACCATCPDYRSS